MSLFYCMLLMELPCVVEYPPRLPIKKLLCYHLFVTQQNLSIELKYSFNRRDLSLSCSATSIVLSAVLIIYDGIPCPPFYSVSFLPLLRFPFLILLARMRFHIRIHHRSLPHECHFQYGSFPHPQWGDFMLHPSGSENQRRVGSGLC